MSLWITVLKENPTIPDVGRKEGDGKGFRRGDKKALWQLAEAIKLTDHRDRIQSIPDV